MNLVKTYHSGVIESDGTIRRPNISQTVLEPLPLKFAKTGYINGADGQYSAISAAGIYFTNQLQNAATAYTLYYSQDYISSISSTYRNNGASIRCIAR